MEPTTIIRTIKPMDLSEARLMIDYFLSADEDWPEN